MVHLWTLQWWTTVQEHATFTIDAQAVINAELYEGSIRVVSKELSSGEHINDRVTIDAGDLFLRANDIVG